MERPSKEQVDADIEQSAYLSGTAERAQRLAAEVEALREELEGLQRCDCNPDMTDLEEENERLRAEVASTSLKWDEQVLELRAEMEGWKEEAGNAEQLRAENAELRRQLVAANLALQQCTHERVDPNRDPFGGF